jgi:hypothetical protein
VARALAKLGARDRAQLAVVAYEAGPAGRPPNYPDCQTRRGSATVKFPVVFAKLS